MSNILFKYVIKMSSKNNCQYARYFIQLHLVLPPLPTRHYFTSFPVSASQWSHHLRHSKIEA